MFSNDLIYCPQCSEVFSWWRMFTLFFDLRVIFFNFERIKSIEFGIWILTNKYKKNICEYIKGECQFNNVNGAQKSLFKYLYGKHRQQQYIQFYGFFQLLLSSNFQSWKMFKMNRSKCFYSNSFILYPRPESCLIWRTAFLCHSQVVFVRVNAKKTYTGNEWYCVFFSVAFAHWVSFLLGNFPGVIFIFIVIAILIRQRSYWRCVRQPILCLHATEIHTSFYVDAFEWIKNLLFSP